LKLSLTDRINVALAVPLSLLALVVSVTLLVQGRHTGIAVACLVLGVSGLVGSAAFLVDRRRAARRAAEQASVPTDPPRGW